MIKYTFRNKHSYIHTPGIYKVQIVETKFGVSRNGDKTMILTLEDSTEMRITDTFYFTESASWRIYKLLEAVGMADTLKEGDEIGFNDRTFVGLRVKIQVIEEEYTKNGEKKTGYKVKRYISDSELLDNSGTTNPTQPASSGLQEAGDIGAVPLVQNHTLKEGL